MKAMLEHIGLYTDLYELRMLESYVRLHMVESATFSLFARPMRSRPFVVSMGLDLALDVLEAFTFQNEDLDYLAAQGLSKAALDWLSTWKLEAELWAVPDGTVLIAEEPWLELTAPLPLAPQAFPLPRIGRPAERRRTLGRAYWKLGRTNADTAAQT